MRRLLFKRNRLNKRGLIFDAVIFLIVNIAFFAMLFLFVRNSATGPNVKEQILAKQVAMFIDAAKNNTIVELNIGEYKEIAEKNKINNFLRINQTEGKVITALSGESYEYPYFSNYSINTTIQANFLRIEIT